jgi:hypothetical protein
MPTADLCLPLSHVGRHVEDMDAAIAWDRAALSYQLMNGHSQASSASGTSPSRPP